MMCCKNLSGDNLADPVEKVRAFLEGAGYEGEIFHSEETIRTVDDASRSVGAPPEEILKTLVLLADGEPYVACSHVRAEQDRSEKDKDPPRREEGLNGKT